MSRRRYFPQHEAKRRTLGELIARQLESVKAERPDDYDRQRVMLAWWEDKLGDYTLDAITPELVTRHRDLLQSQEGFSNGTVNRYLTMLSKTFNNAVREWHLLRDNPVARVSKKPEPRGIVRFLSEEERARLLDACKRSEYKPLYLLALFAMTTGTRRGEMFGLRWQDIDLDRSVAVLQNTKNGDRRSVPIVPEVAALLREHGKVRKLGNDQVFMSDAAEVWLFDRAWYAALKAAKVKDFRFDDLRHTAASYFAMSGATTAEIAAVLGHRTLQMVKRYAHLSDQHVGAVVERMTQKYFA
jgi:integrase